MFNLLFLLVFYLSSTIVLATEKKDLREKLGLNNIVVFSHVVDEKTSKGSGAIKLKEELESKKANLFGYNELKIYPKSTLFKDNRDLMKAIEKNKVQLAAPSISKLISYNSKLKIFDFPFLFKDVTEVEEFYKKARELLFFPSDISLVENAAKLVYLDKDKKYLVLGLWHSGMKQISSKKQILVKDVKSLKESIIRVQDSEVLSYSFDMISKKAEREDDFSKVKNMLRKGDVDGQESTWANIDVEKYDEYQEYFFETNHGYLGSLLITSNDFIKAVKKQNNGHIWQDILNTVSVFVKQKSEDISSKAKANVVNQIKERIKKDELKKRLGEYGTDRVIETIIEEQIGTQFISFYDKQVYNKQDKNNWCNAIYNNKEVWKKYIQGIEDLIEIAIKDKKDCPFDFLAEQLPSKNKLPNSGNNN